MSTMRTADAFAFALPGHASTQQRLQPLLRRCQNRVRRWSWPRHWSGPDWSAEMRSVGVHAAWQAVQDHDPSDPIALEAFVYNQVMGKMRTRLRNEWAFGQRFVSGLAAVAPDLDDSEMAQAGMDGFPAPEPDPVAGQPELDEGVASLAEKERGIVVALYWDRLTESELGARLGVKRRAINKRKQRILAYLRDRLAHRPPGPSPGGQRGSATKFDSAVPESGPACNR